jgi:WhiB family redox-sensing transcriptional regulator
MLDTLVWGLVEGKARADEATAKRVCATCPVKPACQEFAIANRIKAGVWGGLNEKERANVGHRAKKQRWRARREAEGLPAK